MAPEDKTSLDSAQQTEIQVVVEAVPNQERIPEPQVPESDKEQLERVKKQLEQVLSEQLNLEELKKNLDILIDSMALNPSMISRAAAYWSELPKWQKITIGTVLAVPALLIGILTNITAIIAGSILIAVIYTAASLLLDEHQRASVYGTEHIKEGVNAMANALGSIISSLGILRENLASDIKKLQDKIDQLSQIATQFEGQILNLTEKNKSLHETGTFLRETQGKLEHTVETLTKSVEEERELQKQAQLKLDQTSLKLEQTTLAFEQSQTQLSSKITELHLNNEQLTTNIQQQKELQHQSQLKLDQTSAKLEQTTLANAEQQKKLSKEIAELSSSNQQLKTNLEEQRALHQQSQSQVKQLQSSVEEQRKLQEQTKTNLEQATAAFEQNRAQLSANIAELQTANEKLSDNLKKSDALVGTLQETINSVLDQSRVLDKQQQQGYKAKVDEFLQNREASILAITDRICEAEGKLNQATRDLQSTKKELQTTKDELKQTKDELKQSLDRHTQLLAEQKGQVNVLTQFNKDNKDRKDAQTLKRIGKFAHRNDTAHKTEKSIGVTSVPASSLIPN